MSDLIREPPLDNPVYWVLVRRVAQDLHSDGCTKVRDWYVEACYEHDIHFRTGRTFYNEAISLRWANARLRRVIQARSRLGRFSPLALTRWLGTALLAWCAWRRYRRAGTRPWLGGMHGFDANTAAGSE